MAEQPNGKADAPEEAPPKGVSQEELSRQLQAFQRQRLQGQRRQEQKDKYAFWETQPVAQFEEASTSGSEGPIDKPKTTAEVKKEPYKLPDSFEWTLCDITDDAAVKEVYELLTLNYVEDDDNMFRFNYSTEFLRWALQPPEFCPDWHLGIRVKASGKLVAFITGVPSSMHVKGAVVNMVDINFLCVHKKLRSKRLAPVLIKEITRRVNLRGVWQAAYTAGVLLPKPVATCQYYHRSLNPKTLIGAGFSSMNPRMTMSRTLKLYKVDSAPKTPGVRPFTAEDVPQVTQLLESYLKRFQLAPSFSADEVKHYFTPVKDVIDTYVVEQGGQITDMFSYYTLPSTVIGNQQYPTMKAAFMFYTVATKTPLKDLMMDSLIVAHAKGHDVFNALDILENSSFLKDLKFHIGDGKLRYYLYNWRMAEELDSKDVGLILL